MESDKQNKLLHGMAISRLMGPKVANIYGNVHGGHILDLMDEAGIVISSRYCNNAPNKDPSLKDDSITVLARIEHMDFLLPMHVGEVAQLEAEIVYTSDCSMEVIVTVYAENIIKGEKRLTNRARLWYVSLPMNNIKGDCLPVPAMSYATEEAKQRGLTDYQRQKEERAKKEQDDSWNRPHGLFSPSKISLTTADIKPCTVVYSSTYLSVLIGVSDVTIHNHCRGGVILKLMDECAGITARKHCQTVAVTARIEATNFHKKIPLGSLVNVYGWINFTSQRSMEIEVVAELEMPFKHGSTKNRAVDAIFTLVAINESGIALPVPELKVLTEEERNRFEKGRQRYEERKKRRLSEKFEHKDVGT